MSAETEGGAPVAGSGADAATETESPGQPRRPNLRFLWESDLDGALVSLSRDFADLVGQEAASATQGRRWPDLLAGDVVDLEGDLAERLATSSTWSGQAVLWRVRSGEGARVELSGFPLFNGERSPAGFRGFGLVRSPANEAFPERDTSEGEAVPAAPEAEPAIVEVPEAAGTEEPVAQPASDDIVEAEPVAHADRADVDTAPLRTTADFRGP